MAKAVSLDELDVAYDEDDVHQSKAKTDERVLDLSAPPVEESSEALKTVDITPDVSLIRKSGQTGYRAWESLAEFDDNSVDNRIPGEQLVVENYITRDKTVGNKITVIDNGTGMTEAELEKSMVLAYSVKTGDKIGMFGMGMKTAASNLGKRFTITTCTAEMDHALQLTYDEAKFVASGKWEVSLAKIRKPFPHGTRIDITQLRVNLYGELVNTVKRNLAANFKHFIDNGEVVIKVNDDVVKPEEPELLEGYTTHFQFVVNGKRVHGWAGLKKTGSQRGRYGFDLIRHNRIVSRYAKIGFVPHPALTWIQGELFLDNFEVTANKRDFVRDTDDWNELSKKVYEAIKEVVRNSRKRAHKNLPLREREQADQFSKELEQVSASNGLRSDVRVAVLDAALEAEAEAAEGQSGSAATKGGTAKGGTGPKGDKSGKGVNNVVPLTPKDATKRADRITTELLGVKIVHEVAALGTRLPYWEYDVDERVGETIVHVVTNLDHPVYRNITDFDLATRIKENIVEALASHLCDVNGVNTREDFITWKSLILKRHAQMKLGQLPEGEPAPDEVDPMLG
jgi:hypothetical protein